MWRTGNRNTLQVTVYFNHFVYSLPYALTKKFIGAILSSRLVTLLPLLVFKYVPICMENRLSDVFNIFIKYKTTRSWMGLD